MPTPSRPSRTPKTPPENTREFSPVPVTLTTVHSISHEGTPPSTREVARISEIGVAASFAFRMDLHQTPRLEVPFPHEPSQGTPIGTPTNATISIRENGELVIRLSDSSFSFHTYSLTNQRKTIRQFSDFLIAYLAVSEPA